MYIADGTEELGLELYLVSKIGPLNKIRTIFSILVE